MAPSVFGVGAVASGISAITPGFPAAYTPTPDHIALTVAECEGVTAPGAYTLPSGWAHVTGSPVLQGTNTRLWAIWKRLVGGETAPSLGDSGDHNVGRMMIIEGCPSSGNPWNVVSVAVEALSDVSAVWPGVLTTVDDCLILEILASSADSATPPLGGTPLINGAYTSITTQINDGIIAGNGGAIGVVSAVKATQGATGQSTGTLAVAGFKAFMTLAMAPAGIGSTNRWSRGFPAGSRYSRTAVHG